jgi:hypothetical protein
MSAPWRPWVECADHSTPDDPSSENTRIFLKGSTVSTVGTLAEVAFTSRILAAMMPAADYSAAFARPIGKNLVGPTVKDIRLENAAVVVNQQPQGVVNSNSTSSTASNGTAP